MAARMQCDSCNSTLGLADRYLSYLRALAFAFLHSLKIALRKEGYLAVIKAEWKRCGVDSGVGYQAVIYYDLLPPISCELPVSGSVLFNSLHSLQSSGPLDSASDWYRLVRFW